MNIKYELPILHQYELVCDRVLHWCQPILRIGEIGALTYVIVYPSNVHCIEYINRLFVLLQTLCIGLIDIFNSLLSLSLLLALAINYL